MINSDEGTNVNEPLSSPGQDGNVEPLDCMVESNDVGSEKGVDNLSFGDLIGACDASSASERTGISGATAFPSEEAPSEESNVPPLHPLGNDTMVTPTTTDAKRHTTCDDVNARNFSQRWESCCGASALHFPLLSLPIDSLHCIASFLTPIEWPMLGRCNRAASRVYREVFRRVRMHGFRCAKEIITSWKLGQHADAKELTALYIQNGVPIYPHSLGHSYHTLIWRMGIESREMQLLSEQREGVDERANTRNSRGRVDRFFSERVMLRSHSEFNQRMTYLEEKCLFILNQEESLDVSGRAGDHRRASLTGARTTGTMQDHLLAGSQIARGEQQVAPARNIRSTESFDGLMGPRSNSKAIDTGRLRSPKPTVKIHQHLLDQHMLGRTSVDDQDGSMRTPPVSLSADFFHPCVTKKPATASSSKVFQPEKAMLASPAELEHSWDPSPTFTYADMQDDGIPFPTDTGDTILQSGFAYDEVEQSEVLRSQRTASSETRTRADAESSPVVPIRTRSPEPIVSSQSVQHSLLNDVELEVYSASTASPKWKSDVGDGVSEIKSHLRTRFAVYQRRLEALLAHNDNSGFDECILDFWDEFLPLTANIHYYDRHTAVPRVSALHKFLTKPCPKNIGIVQCEIERIKINSKKKGVNMKGRFFPVYEYRLFIRHRPGNSSAESSENGDAATIRRDTVLIAAKNRGRNHVDVSGVVPLSSSAKKGVNNYFLYLPQQTDIDAHFNSVNEGEKPAIAKGTPNGASYEPNAQGGGAVLLGRLQSNIIGTEFQIFTPSICKRPARKTATQSNNSAISSDDEDVGYDSGMSSDTASAASRRRNRFSRRLSLRRNNVPPGDQPLPIDEEIASSAETRIKRTGSWPVLSYSRSSRTSRRAIANTAGVPETQPQFQTILCEEEDGAITYTANLLGNRPRIMDVCIPKVSAEGMAGAEWKRFIESCIDTSDAGSGNKMLHRFKQLQQRLENNDQNNINEAHSVNEDGYVPPDDFGLLALQNRPPWWNIELGAFVLNFGGRVSVASVKNFQLCDRNDHDNIMLQFGRIHGRHSFTMDFKYPLTAVQAFAIAISSLQSKISFG